MRPFLASPFLASWETWAWSTGILAGSVVFGLIVRTILFAVARRFARRAPTALKESLLHHSRRMSRWILPLFALALVSPVAPLPEAVKTGLQRLVGLALIASVAWLVALFADVSFDLFASRYRIDVADNLNARKVQTQVRAVRRLILIAITVVALALMLMTFPPIRHIGTSLLASAGLAGLIVGMAMKSSLASLLAGIQIALTQPIRIDDVVVVQGEWGRIEEIETTYVVVRLWDLRRLVVPLSYFIEQPFENWTRTGADLLAYVLLWVDYTAPVEELRTELTRILESTKMWKGQVNVLQVTDANDRSIQIRALMDAADSSTAFDLRCYVRENLIQFLQKHRPDCLPKFRGELSEASANGSSNHSRALAAPAATPPV
jgi:small-conductance mechanosensitive channel